MTDRQSGTFNDDERRPCVLFVKVNPRRHTEDSEISRRALEDCAIEFRKNLYWTHAEKIVPKIHRSFVQTLQKGLLA
jgi:hypothetical protein